MERNVHETAVNGNTYPRRKPSENFRNTMRSERSGRVILNRRRKRGCENFENIMRGDIDIVS